nr:hypothetical protein [Tanacetum cinerariifolium]
MASSITRFDIEKLDGNIIQNHEGSKQVGLKQLVHRVQIDKCVWFEVDLHGAQEDRKAGVFQVSNDDDAITQRWLENKQLEERTNTDCLVKEQKKVHLRIKVGADITVTKAPGIRVVILWGVTIQVFQWDVGSDIVGWTVYAVVRGWSVRES